MINLRIDNPSKLAISWNKLKKFCAHFAIDWATLHIRTRKKIAFLMCASLPGNFLFTSRVTETVCYCVLFRYVFKKHLVKYMHMPTKLNLYFNKNDKVVFSSAFYMKISSPHFTNSRVRVLQVRSSPLLQYAANIEFDFRFRQVKSPTSQGTRLMENIKLVPRVILVTAHG